MELQKSSSDQLNQNTYQPVLSDTNSANVANSHNASNINGNSNEGNVKQEFILAAGSNNNSGNNLNCQSQYSVINPNSRATRIRMDLISTSPRCSFGSCFIITH